MAQILDLQGLTTPGSELECVCSTISTGCCSKDQDP